MTHHTGIIIWYNHINSFVQDYSVTTILHKEVDINVLTVFNTLYFENILGDRISEYSFPWNFVWLSKIVWTDH